MTIISSNVLIPDQITSVQPTYAYIYALGHCTHNTQDLGLMHTKFMGLFDFEPKIPYYMDQLFVDVLLDHFSNFQQFELPFAILLCSACLGHVSNVFLICSIS